MALVCGLMACGVSDRIGKQVDGTWAGDMLHADNEQVVLTSDGGDQLNPDATGAPLSVVLRVYQLAALERFASASADGLWHMPNQVLGNSLIENHELTVLPGLGQVDKWPLNKAARYVGVAAFFRENTDARWKVAFDANSLRKDGILFSSNGMRVLVNRNEVMATRGIDVLGKPKALEPSAESLKSSGPHDTAGPLTSISKTPLESIE
ncbi:type VI secretion system lipoprotein TssJ [Pseudomonas japonica]|uniref:type VI secretion system lipoprotein TssJ n=1 Tax=Pseudomonas japonica TaxID=256466 RepID=UPI002158BAC4|nr:type VI secretion system lipoprotein TssJ [Pseudomonas japonica]MBA1245057.1 type VI secretion system lipoprotein TssJ [Pseudomonas japonica]